MPIFWSFTPWAGRVQVEARGRGVAPSCDVHTRPGTHCEKTTLVTTLVTTKFPCIDYDLSNKACFVLRGIYEACYNGGNKPRNTKQALLLRSN